MPAQETFASSKEFNDYLDKKIETDAILNKYEESGECWSDLLILQEQARTEIIKTTISATHNWSQATIMDRGHQLECFWCGYCGIKASIFDHIGCLSIISKVRDKRPTYTTHNQYLMYPCSQIARYQQDINDRACQICGLPEQLADKLCQVR